MLAADSEGEDKAIDESQVSNQRHVMDSEVVDHVIELSDFAGEG